MILITPFHSEHLRYLTVQPVQSDELRALRTPEGGAVLLSPHARTAWAYGCCLGSAGVVQHWHGRYEVWALLSPHVAPYMLQIVRRMRSVITAEKFRRLEFVVHVENHCGHKLARLLGFTQEGVMCKYMLDGSDAVRYVRL